MKWRLVNDGWDTSLGWKKGQQESENLGHACEEEGEKRQENKDGKQTRAKLRDCPILDFLTLCTPLGVSADLRTLFYYTHTLYVHVDSL